MIKTKELSLNMEIYNLKIASLPERETDFQKHQQTQLLKSKLCWLKSNV